MLSRIDGRAQDKGMPAIANMLDEQASKVLGQPLPEQEADESTATAIKQDDNQWRSMMK